MELCIKLKCILYERFSHEISTELIEVYLFYQAAEIILFSVMDEIKVKVMGFRPLLGNADGKFLAQSQS